MRTQDLVGTLTGEFLIGIPSGKEGILYPIRARVVSPMGGMLSVTGENFHCLVEQVWFLDEKKCEPGVPIPIPRKTRPAVVERKVEKKETAPPPPPPRKNPLPSVPLSRNPSAYRKMAEKKGDKTFDAWQAQKNRDLEAAKAQEQEEQETVRVDYEKMMVEIVDDMSDGSMYKASELKPDNLSEYQWNKLRLMLLEEDLLEKHGNGRGTRYAKAPS